MRAFTLLTLCASIALPLVATARSSPVAHRSHASHPTSVVLHGVPKPIEAVAALTPRETAPPLAANVDGKLMSRLSEFATNEFLAAVKELLRDGLRDPAEFDARTRALVSAATGDSRALCWLLVARGLVLGPRANIGLLNMEWYHARNGYLASLAAHKLDGATTDEQLQAIATWCVFGNIDRIYLGGRGSGFMDPDRERLELGFDEDVRFAFGRVSDPVAMEEALRASRLNPTPDDFALRCVLPGDDPRVRDLALADLATEDKAHDDGRCEAAVECLADADADAQRVLLGLASDPKVPPDRRAAIVSTVGEVAKADFLSILAGYRTSSDARTRAACEQAFSHSPDGLLSAALVEAEKCIRYEEDSRVRREMIEDLSHDRRGAAQRQAILLGLASTDPDPSCRSAADWGARRLE